MTPILDGGTPWGFPAPSPGTGTTQAILSLVSRQLQDLTGKTWDQTTVLIPYMNLAIGAIINEKPEALPSTGNISLVAGAIQKLVAGSFFMIDVVCNMGADGNTQGKAVTSIKKEHMDSLYPGWLNHPADSEVTFVIEDDRDPKTFYIFPPQPDPPTQKLRVIAATTPDLITAVTDPFPLDDSYQEATLDYIIYRALKEETTIPNAQTKADSFFSKFMADLGLKTQAEKKSYSEGE